MPQTSVSDVNVSADAAGASGPQGPESPRRRALAYLPVALLVAAILAGIYYYFQVYELRSKQDGLGLLVEAYIRETVPGLRTPQYWPVHGPRGTTRNPNDIPFVYSSDAFEGALAAKKIEGSASAGVGARSTVGTGDSVDGTKAGGGTGRELPRL